MSTTPYCKQYSDFVPQQETCLHFLLLSILFWARTFKKVAYSCFNKSFHMFVFGICQSRTEMLIGGSVGSGSSTGSWHLLSWLNWTLWWWQMGIGVHGPHLCNVRRWKRRTVTFLCSRMYGVWGQAQTFSVTCRANSVTYIICSSSKKKRCVIHSLLPSIVMFHII